MQWLNRWSLSWFDWMIAASWQLAVLACVIGLVCLIAKKGSARLRHGLWLLVLLKVFLPTTLASPISFGAWVLGPLSTTAISNPLISEIVAFTRPNEPNAAETRSMQQVVQTDKPVVVGSRTMVLLLIWSFGIIVFWCVVISRYWRIARALKTAEEIDEGPIRVALEKIALALRIKRLPEVVVADVVACPFLMGVLRPVIVLPRSFFTGLDQDHQQAVLIHELVHWSRFDTWIGVIQVISQDLFWFHPLVWWSNAQLRHERECACDEVVLQMGQIGPMEYGESIVRVLTASCGRSLVAASLVGVFERGPYLQFRLEEIMNYKKSNHSDWFSSVFVALFGILFLPLAGTNKGAWTTIADESKAAKVPTIVATSPKIGQTGVDPHVNEIRVTFDCDMEEGMSWTGGPPLFPTVPENRKAKWLDKRTCVLPVELEEGGFYRVGINSTSFQNFQSSKGIPAHPAVIYFTTSGVPDARTQIPKVVKLEPANGTEDVSPETSQLVVSFDRPMGDGMSWCNADDLLDDENDEKPKWSSDGRRCTLPVKLQPGKEYEIGLNSSEHINFQSKWGVPLAPVIYKFCTANTTESATPDKPQKNVVPKIVSLEPANGASDVDPDIKELKVTFDIPMGKGMSWTGSGPKFPQVGGGGAADWSANGKSCTLRVTLEPGHDYELGINSKSFKNFRSKDGVPARPVVYKFHTANRGE